MNRLLDFWSVPHFLFGVVSALITVAFAFPEWPMFFATLGGAILWEIFESRFDLGEVSWNVASDILLPLTAFPVTFSFATHPLVTQEHRVLLLVVAFFVFVYVNAIAWRARFEGDSDFKS